MKVIYAHYLHDALGHVLRRDAPSVNLADITTCRVMRRSTLLRQPLFQRLASLLMVLVRVVRDRIREKKSLVRLSSSQVRILESEIADRQSGMERQAVGRLLQGGCKVVAPGKARFIRKILPLGKVKISLPVPGAA